MKISEAIARNPLEVHYNENCTGSWITKALEDLSRIEVVLTAGSADTIASFPSHHFL